MRAPRRPRRVLKPSASMTTMARKSSRLEIAIGPGAAEQREEIVLGPFLGGDLGGDLLGQHVEGLLGDRDPVQLAALDALEQGGAFHQLVARQREEPPLGRPVHRMAGAPDPLEEARDGARRAHLADEIDLADIDAQLQRGRGHQRLQLAPLQPLLGIQPLLAGEAAVMGGAHSPRPAARRDGG